MAPIHRGRHRRVRGTVGTGSDQEGPHPGPRSCPKHPHILRWVGQTDPREPDPRHDHVRVHHSHQVARGRPVGMARIRVRRRLPTNARSIDGCAREAVPSGARGRHGPAGLRGRGQRQRRGRGRTHRQRAQPGTHPPATRGFSAWRTRPRPPSGRPPRAARAWPAPLEPSPRCPTPGCDPPLGAQKVPCRDAVDSGPGSVPTEADAWSFVGFGSSVLDETRTSRWLPSPAEVLEHGRHSDRTIAGDSAQGVPDRPSRVAARPLAGAGRDTARVRAVHRRQADIVRGRGSQVPDPDGPGDGRTQDHWVGLT